MALIAALPALASTGAFTGGAGVAAAGGGGLSGLLGGLGGLSGALGGLGGLFGGGSGGDAAEAQALAFMKGIEELRRQFNITREDLAPFLEAGTGALGDVTAGATIGGFGERLQELFSGGALDPLIEERQRAVESGLSARGLSRSGTAIRELADIPTQLGFDLENLLFGRASGLAGAGQSAAAGLGGFGAQTAQGIAGLQGDIGRARGAGIITDAQTQTEQINQLLQIGATALPKITSFF